MRAAAFAAFCLLLAAEPVSGQDYPTQAAFLAKGGYGAIGIANARGVTVLDADAATAIPRNHRTEFNFLLNHVDPQSTPADWKATYVAVLAVLSYANTQHLPSLYLFRNGSTNWFRSYCRRCIGRDDFRKSLPTAGIAMVAGARSGDQEEGLDDILGGPFDAQLVSDNRQDTWAIRAFWSKPGDRHIACPAAAVCDVKNYLLGFTPSGGHAGATPVNWHMYVGAATALDLYLLSPSEDEINGKHYHIDWQ